MIAYSEIKVEDTLYDLVEHQTNSIIELKKPKEIVNDLLKRLNNGHGFDGFTPGFFLVRMDAK